MEDDEKPVAVGGEDGASAPPLSSGQGDPRGGAANGGVDASALAADYGSESSRAEDAPTPDAGGVSAGDAALVERTTDSVLAAVDLSVRRFIAGRAAAAHLPQALADDLRGAVALPIESRKLLSSLAPSLLRQAGLDPASYPLTCAAVVVGTWGLAIHSAVLAINDFARAREGVPDAPP